MLQDNNATVKTIASFIIIIEAFDLSDHDIQQRIYAYLKLSDLHLPDITKLGKT